MRGGRCRAGGLPCAYTLAPNGDTLTLRYGRPTRLAAATAGVRELLDWPCATGRGLGRDM